ncbi:unnamed protein product [Paramecium octaurelia]|uniref:Uncharacterized protein n=1 Tax=Paramecium octaurelia TaxID=43137 RepID=A0A8S1YFB8_PAROT|nr:unnamed protein product [Paramecium octaurelia]
MSLSNQTHRLPQLSIKDEQKILQDEMNSNCEEKLKYLGKQNNYYCCLGSDQQFCLVWVYYCEEARGLGESQEKKKDYFYSFEKEKGLVWREDSDQN